MRRPSALHHAFHQVLAGIVVAAGLATSACNGASTTGAQGGATSTAPPTSSPTPPADARQPHGWVPVQDPDFAVWFSLPEQPVLRTTDRVTTSGAHLVAHQYESFHTAVPFAEPVAVIVTPFSLSGGSYATARDVFAGMRDQLVSEGAHGVRLTGLRSASIDGRRGHLATLRFTTKDRAAEGYWRLGHLARPGFAVLIQVQVSGPHITRQLSTSGDRLLREVLTSIRLPGR